MHFAIVLMREQTLVTFIGFVKSAYYGFQAHTHMHGFQQKAIPNGPRLMILQLLPLLVAPPENSHQLTSN